MFLQRSVKCTNLMPNQKHQRTLLISFFMVTILTSTHVFADGTPPNRTFKLHTTDRSPTRSHISVQNTANDSTLDDTPEGTDFIGFDTSPADQPNNSVFQPGQFVTTFDGQRIGMRLAQDLSVDGLLLGYAACPLGPNGSPIDDCILITEQITGSSVVTRVLISQQCENSNEWCYAGVTQIGLQTTTIEAAESLYTGLGSYTGEEVRTTTELKWLSKPKRIRSSDAFVFDTLFTEISTLSVTGSSRVTNVSVYDSDGDLIDSIYSSENVEDGDSESDDSDEEPTHGFSAQCQALGQAYDDVYQSAYEGLARPIALLISRIGHCNTGALVSHRLGSDPEEGWDRGCKHFEAFRDETMLPIMDYLANINKKLYRLQIEVGCTLATEVSFTGSTSTLNPGDDTSITELEESICGEGAELTVVWSTTVEEGYEVCDEGVYDDGSSWKTWCPTSYERHEAQYACIPE